MEINLPGFGTRHSERDKVSLIVLVGGRVGQWGFCDLISLTPALLYRTPTPRYYVDKQYLLSTYYAVYGTLVEFQSTFPPKIPPKHIQEKPFKNSYSTKAFASI